MEAEPTASVGPEDQAPLMADCLAGGGEMGALIRGIDWSQTPVGPVSDWSPPFRTLVGLVLRNRFPLSLWWGPELVQFYNDPFVSRCRSLWAPRTCPRIALKPPKH